MGLQMMGRAGEVRRQTTLTTREGAETKGRLGRGEDGGERRENREILPFACLGIFCETNLFV